ncbi:hypothetical protein GYMLUDRAFT_260613 [Collybiopsis luxurians FD-317 M1]|uniref:Uncharacterized protein n=1 Tax=Collybiopsis luxurians FD-317 M1 TaxID=944289 RepID=A0A0D0CR21_9AGAR|nr:hypothetical protein GYMLUDRAFT_260613 [Collybiopsis luxurians FD-317 M1]
MTRKLDQLGIDILETILLTIHNSSRHSLFSILTTNKTLYKLALPFIFRHCHFNVGSHFKQITLPRLLLLFKNDFALRSIRILTLTGRRSPGNDIQDLENWKTLVQLISQIVHLEQLIIQTRYLKFPLNVLGALRPHTKLYVYDWLPSSFVSWTIEDEELSKSPNLHLIQIDASTCCSSGDSSRLQTFERIAWLAPNLRVISATSRCFCITHPFRRQIELAVQLQLSRNAIQVRRKQVKEIELDGAFVGPHSLEYLSQFVYINQLTTLGVWPGPEFLLMAARGLDGKNMFSYLKELRLTLYLWGFTSESMASALNLFLSTCPPLFALELIIPVSKDVWPLSLIWPTILTNHGLSLRILRYHHAEAANINSQPRACLSADDLRQLCSRVPHLEEFEFDIDRTRSAEHEREIYTSLCTVASLRRLIIHMDIGLLTKTRTGTGDDNSNKPQVFGGTYRQLEKTSMIQIWTLLTNQQVRLLLDELIVHIGERERYADTYEWEAWSWQWFRAKRSERDDKKCEADFQYEYAPTPQWGYMENRAVDR